MHLLHPERGRKAAALSVSVGMPWKVRLGSRVDVLPQMLHRECPVIVLLAQRQAVHEHELVPGPHRAAGTAAGLGHVEKDAAVQTGMERRVEVDAVGELLREGRDCAVVREVIARELGPGHQQRRADRAVRRVPAAARRCAGVDVHEVDEMAVGRTVRVHPGSLAGMRGENVHNALLGIGQLVQMIERAERQQGEACRVRRGRMKAAAAEHERIAHQAGGQDRVDHVVSQPVDLVIAGAFKSWADAEPTAS